MDITELRERLRQRHLAELDRGELGLWWLSFADEDGFKGVVILEAYGPIDALARTGSAGLNPGGEVQLVQVDPEDIPEGLRNRLLKKPDLAGFGVSTRTRNV